MREAITFISPDQHETFIHVDPERVVAVKGRYPTKEWPLSEIVLDGGSSVLVREDYQKVLDALGWGCLRESRVRRMPLVNLPVPKVEGPDEYSMDDSFHAGPNAKAPYQQPTQDEIERWAGAVETLGSESGAAEIRKMGSEAGHRELDEESEDG